MAFDLLMESARQKLWENPAAQQVIVLKTAKDHIYFAVNHDIINGDHREEDACIRALEENGDTAVSAMVCMWQGGCLDVASWHFRSALLQIDPNNENAETVLQGAEMFHVKQLKALIPPK